MSITTRKTIFASILENISIDTIRGAIAGNVSNLFCEHMNDYASANHDAAEFIKENIAHLDSDDIAIIIESPDWIINQAVDVFRDTLTDARNHTCNAANWMLERERTDEIINNAKCWFDSWGNYYVFALPWSNACVTYYIIRADDEPTAFAELLTRFESDFSVDGDDIQSEDYQTYNDNGKPVNIDNLQMIAQFNFQPEGN